MSNYPRPDSETLLNIYKNATLIKQNDARVMKELKSGRLVTPYYSARGQEMIPAALSVNLSDDDYITTIYRGTHDMLAKGYPLDDMWAELAGRVTGTCKGKGGTMHLTHPEKGIMVTSGIVGSSMPIANGLAWASQLDGTDQVTIANFGDGASNIGAFHEALNLASLWKLPVIFMCQNNLYGEHTRFAKATAIDQISKRSNAYSMEGITIDGNDPDEVYGATKLAIERARRGDGPTLIEAMTYRFNGHVVGDVGGYMDKDEYARAVENDPFPKLRARLVEDGIATEADIQALEQGVEDQISAAIEAAYAAPYPELGELKRDVYAQDIQ